MSVYGHCSMLESRLPLSKISGFAEYALKVAKDNEEQFYTTWKRHLAMRLPDAEVCVSESETDSIMQLLGSDDEGPVPAPGSAAAVPAAAEDDGGA